MGLRWALSLSSTEASPNFELSFRKALQSLPSDDITKQRRFHYRNDSLACIAGRIMIRAATCRLLGIPWYSVEISRTDKGKPFLMGNPFHFNISHQGDLVVLATSRKKLIGIDVMRIDVERGICASDHIQRMKNLFSHDEMSLMLSNETDLSKWFAFYRIWCLKEAVLKASGVGLVHDLSNHSFQCSTKETHEPGCFIKNTMYSENGNLKEQWRFEESFIGSNHCVAVGKIYSSKEEALQAKLRPKQFTYVTLEELLEKATSCYQEDLAFEFDHFIVKPWKTF